MANFYQGRTNLALVGAGESAVLIYDVKAQRVTLTKSVDMRGNDDVSWQRAVRFLVRDMQDKRAANPAYGQ